MAYWPFIQNSWTINLGGSLGLPLSKVTINKMKLEECSVYLQVVPCLVLRGNGCAIWYRGKTFPPCLWLLLSKQTRWDPMVLLHTMILSSFSLFHDLFPCLSLFYGHLLYQCSCSLFHCSIFYCLLFLVPLVLCFIVHCSIVHCLLFHCSYHCSLFYCSYYCSLVPLSIVHCSSYHCSLYVYIARYL